MTWADMGIQGIHQSFSNATRLKRLGACRLDDSTHVLRNSAWTGSVENLRTPTKSVRQLANLPAPEGKPQLRSKRHNNSSCFISDCSLFSLPFFVRVELSGEATEQGDI